MISISPDSISTRVQQCITDRLSYVDTARVHVPRRLVDEEAAMLRSFCKWEYGRSRKRKPKPYFNGRMYLERLDIQRPKTDAINYLRQLFAHEAPPIMNAVHISLDLITETPEEARRLQEYIVTHIYIPYFSQVRGFTAFEGEQSDSTTYYFGRQGRPETIAVYSDKSSKIATNQPCCHFEMRLQGLSRLRRFGIGNIEDILDLDYRAFWQQFLARVKWVEIDLDRLQKRIVKRWPGRRIDMNFWLQIIAKSAEYSSDWKARGGVKPTATSLVLWSRRAKLGSPRQFVSLIPTPRLELPRAHARGLYD